MTFVPKKYEKEGEKVDTVTSIKEYNNLPEIEVTILPSQFKAYPKGCSIKYNPYTFGEIKNYSESKISVKDRVDFILRGIHTSFNKYKLTHSDFLWVALLRKLATFGVNKFSIVYKCSSCNKMSTAIINDDEIGFDDLEIPKLPIIVTLTSGQELHFSPITLEDYFKVESDLNDYIKIISNQVRNIKIEEAYRVISGLTNPDDFKNMNEVDRLLYHGVKPLICKCKNKLKDGIICGKETHVSVDEEDTLIFPFREDNDSKRNSIRFGI